MTNNEPENLVTLCASCHLKLHWKLDRAERMASILARTRQPSSDGKRYLAERPRRRPSEAREEGNGFHRGLLSS